MTSRSFEFSGPELDTLQQMLLRPNNTSLKAPLLYDVTGLDPDRVASAVTGVLARHTSLRSALTKTPQGETKLIERDPVSCAVRHYGIIDAHTARSPLRALADVPFTMDGGPLVCLIFVRRQSE
mgnify:FL=1